MDLHAAEVADWFLSQINTPLVIRKEEQGDVDQVHLTVHKVSFLPGHPDRDDYVEEDRIVLQGDGRIAGELDSAATDLPRHSYEIPLQAGFRSSLEQDGLTLVTDRALYRVTPQ